MELEPTEGHRLTQQFGNGSGCQTLFQMRHTLVEGQIEVKLNKPDQITPAATPMAVKQVLVGVDIKGRTGIPMQGTQPNEFLGSASAMGSPVVSLQVFQQRNTLFEPDQILAQGQSLLSLSSVGQGSLHSQARMVGVRPSLQPQGPEMIQTGEEGLPAQAQAAMAEMVAGSSN